ncbi:MAG TPA: membrane protein insertion efficiency factor YidD [Kiritimatiellia bacterium]|nr:membrane protein insertion efficiency factor YidD [Kiritimatiellia bacterium]
MLTVFSRKAIPGFISGIAFFIGAGVFAASIDLAVQLFEEEQWDKARRECLRVLYVSPDDEQALMMLAVSALRENASAVEYDGIFTRLVETGSPEIRAISAYELGRLRWLAGNMEDAWRYHAIAFESTRSPWLYLHSACALDTLRRRYPKIATQHPSINTQVDTTRPLWNRDIRYASNPENFVEKSRRGPGSLFIAFYRSQVRPAIGRRCSLHPSCSEYFLEANHDHGWLAVPMVADRLVREPGVVSKAERPVLIGNEFMVEDPLRDHNFWMKGEKR